jgi:hypothetical protein
MDNGTCFFATGYIGIACLDTPVTTASKTTTKKNIPTTMTT